jgi:ABC-2 type transport system ATP-binding protein
LTNVPVPAVEIDGVTKRYGRTLALDNVSFQVRPNELFALLGPNGAGKTTLLHILCTILRPDSGTARIGGVDLIKHPLDGRRHLGVVFQEPSLDDRLTLYENLNFHGLVYGVPAAARRKRIADMLALVELTDWRDRLVRTLSSGMKRRLEIAAHSCTMPASSFLDEPTVGLDAQSRERLWQYLHRLRSERELTLIITTHYIEEVEDCDRVCVIDLWQSPRHRHAGCAQDRTRAGAFARGCERGGNGRGNHGRLSRSCDPQGRGNHPQVDR